MSDSIKITKAQYFSAIKDAIASTNMVGDIPTATVVEWIDGQIAQIEAKAAKAKERAAEKKASGDELCDVVASILTSEFQTADQIAICIEGADVTKNKVIARLTKLVGDGVAVKEQIKVDGGKKMAYKLA